MVFLFISIVVNGPEPLLYLWMLSANYIEQESELTVVISENMGWTTRRELPRYYITEPSRDTISYLAKVVEQKHRFAIVDLICTRDFICRTC